MRSNALPVSCPFCATRAVVDFDSTRFAANFPDRLRGTEIDCQECDNEFILYHY